jgi:hypothetical protein
MKAAFQDCGILTRINELKKSHRHADSLILYGGVIFFIDSDLKPCYKASMFTRRLAFERIKKWKS